MSRVLPIAFAVPILFGFGTTLAAADESKLAPARVNLSSKQPLSKAMKAIQDQTGTPVVSDLGDPEVAVELKNATLWQALDAVAEAAGGRVYLYRTDGRLAIVKDDRMAREKQPVSHSGLFRVAIRRLAAAQDFDTGVRSYSATLEVAWEPRFQPFYLESRPQKLIMHDAAGNPVDVPAAGSLLTPVDGKRAAMVDVTLPALKRPAGKIGLLQGTLSARGPSKLLTFEFDSLDRLKADLAGGRAPQKTQDGVTCSVTRVQTGARVWTVRMSTVLPEGGPEFESFQSWDAYNEIWLMHRDGKTRLDRTSYSRASSSSRRAVLTYAFENIANLADADPKNWTLYYRAPASIIELPIPFEFRDVTLP